jgi:hypothetical protein
LGPNDVRPDQLLLLVHPTFTAAAWSPGGVGGGLESFPDNRRRQDYPVDIGSAAVEGGQASSPLAA